jgi:hypothetical protein
MEKAYTILSQIVEQNRQLMRPKRRLNNNIKANIKYDVNMYCELARDRTQRIY